MKGYRPLPRTRTFPDADSYSMSHFAVPAEHAGIDGYPANEFAHAENLECLMQEADSHGWRFVAQVFRQKSNEPVQFSYHYIFEKHESTQRHVAKESTLSRKTSS